MLIRSLKLTNLLSFGGDSEPIELGPLNVLIGPNGSGKSNLIEGMGLLRSTPRNLEASIAMGGGVREWLWKGSSEDRPTAGVEAVVDYPKGPTPLRYRFAFAANGHRFEITDERIENAEPGPGAEGVPFYYGYENGRPTLNAKGELLTVRREDLNPGESILSQRKDPDRYPELTYLGEALLGISIYRDWTFGRLSKSRLPQKADLPNHRLMEDVGNLGLVLNRIRREPAVKRRLLEELQKLYEGIEDFEVSIEGGTVQVFFQEGLVTVPAFRLSDGTLRYLCLLAILCHPSPLPLICIEEPELGLHPDVLPSLAGLLREASERTQLIVTTHSDILVRDAGSRGGLRETGRRDLDAASRSGRARGLAREILAGSALDPRRSRRHPMVTVRLYVEGGGDAKSLRTACRRGFREFLLRAGLGGSMPRIIACGPRPTGRNGTATPTAA